MTKLSAPQIKALKMVEKRNWPAGEPRLGWLHKATGSRLLSDDLIATVEGSEKTDRWAGIFRASPVVILTPAGRAALSASRSTDHDK